MPEIQHEPCCEQHFLSLIQSRLAALPATTMKKLSLLASALLASAYACADDTNTNADVRKRILKSVLLQSALRCRAMKAWVCWVVIT
jgi:hypothetical protein